MRDCSHPHIPAQFLLIRRRWTNPGEGEAGFEEAREMLSAPTRESHSSCALVTNLLWGLGQHHQVKPSTIPRGKRVSRSETQLTHAMGKLASCWDIGKAGILCWDTGRSLATRRNSRADTWARCYTLLPAPRVTFSKKDAVSVIFSTYNWPGLYSCQGKKLLKNSKASDNESAQGSAGRGIQPCWSSWSTPEPPAPPCSG